MRFWPTARSASSDAYSQLPGQWLYYLITLIALLISLSAYIYGLRAHLKTTHTPPLLFENPVQHPDVEIVPRIPVFEVSAKHYANDNSITISPTDEYAPDTVEKMLFYLVPLLGLLITILFLMSMRLVHIARQNVHALDKANQALKLEINDRIQAEETKQKIEKAMLQGQKLQAIGTLAGGIAHDFNNILYAIMGYTEMAQEDVDRYGTVYENLGKVLEASRRGQELIGRILAFGRRQLHHDYTPLRLKSVIENVLMLIKPTIPSSVIVDYRAETHSDCVVLGDQTQIHQVIVNLINNAVDAMHGEGMITILVKEMEANEHLLAGFAQLHKRNYCKIDIIDTGHGMDQSTLDRIFEPFFTTKEVGKGTGLGLATVHSIIEEHGGEIFVTSQPGKGTTFTIFLPEYTPTS